MHTTGGDDKLSEALAYLHVHMHAMNVMELLERKKRGILTEVVANVLVEGDENLRDEWYSKRQSILCAASLEKDLANYGTDGLRNALKGLRCNCT